MQEILTPQQAEELVSGRLYIMDYTGDGCAEQPQDEQNQPQEKPAIAQEADEPLPADEFPEKPVVYERAAHLRRTSDPRPFVCAAAAAAGVIAGVITALCFPAEGADILSGVAGSAQGGFAAELFRRMGQAGIFLLGEYLLGYFAAGGAVVWLLPLVYGLGAGLGAAGTISAGGSLWVIAAELIYTALNVMGAITSGELSKLLLRLISGDSCSVVARGRASRGYNLQFAVYLMIMLAAAITEAAFKTA